MLDGLVAYQQGTRWWPIWRSAFNGPGGTRGLMMRAQPDLVQQWDWIGRAESVTQGAAPSYLLTEGIGPSIDFTAASQEGIKWAGGAYAGTSRVDATLAVVMVVDGNNRCRVLQTSSTNAGMALQIGFGSSNQKLTYTEGGIAERDLATVLSTGVPYFVAITVNNASGLATGYVRRLDQSTVAETTAGIGTSLTAGDGAYTLGNGPFAASFDFDGKIAMAYVGYECLDEALVRAWALDPFAPFEAPDEAPVWAFIPAAAGGGATTDVPLTTFSVSPQAPTTLRSLISNVPTL